MIKNTGMLRKVDELGRVVIPIETRKKFDICEGDRIEVYVESDSIILKKYERTCVFCENTKNLKSYKNKLICKKCLEKIDGINYIE